MSKDCDDRGIAHDPIEKDPIMGPLVRQAREEALESLAKDGILPQLGFCHAVWGKQKEILKERHGIDWKTPREMNPLIMFD